jgi:hypothetical protein
MMNKDLSPEFGDQWEGQVRQAAAALPYPATPEIARQVRQQLVARRQRAQRPLAFGRLAWAAVLVVVLLGGLLAVPAVRAGLLAFLQVGDIRIFFAPPTATATTLPTATATVIFEGEGATQAAVVPVTATPLPTSTPRPSPAPTFSVLNLAGETTLAEAERETGWEIGLPAYPADLGAPDRVFLQNMGGPIVIVVWLQAESEREARVTLYAIDLEEGAFGGKFDWESGRPATVHGEAAYWVTGEHWLIFYDSTGREQVGSSRFIGGNVLIWQRGDVTYRLETDLPLEEAVRIAESIE